MDPIIYLDFQEFLIMEIFIQLLFMFHLIMDYLSLLSQDQVLLIITKVDMVNSMVRI